MTTPDNNPPELARARAELAACAQSAPLHVILCALTVTRLLCKSAAAGHDDAPPAFEATR